MKLVHCDNCNNVIPTDIKRMTLVCGWSKGECGEEENTPRDYCPNCVEKNPILRKAFAEVVASAQTAREP